MSVVAPLRSDEQLAETEVVIELDGVTKEFPGNSRRGRKRDALRAVDDVSFVLRKGRITALVGESGSGKSTVARLIAHLYKPTAGSIRFRGQNIDALSRKRDLLAYRAQVQMVFQDPFGSLNPVRTVMHHVERPLRIHEIVPSNEIEERAYSLLETVGLVPAEDVAIKYPHELSGGQRQRVAIARALAVEPSVVLADEPISMLDVSIRIGILNLMLQLKDEHDLSFLYVTHDIASARYIADEMLVMYAGQIVEHGGTEQVLQNPLHAYTQLLLSAVPNPHVSQSSRALLDRPLPDPTSELVEVEPGHFVRTSSTTPETT